MFDEIFTLSPRTLKHKECLHASKVTTGTPGMHSSCLSDTTRRKGLDNLCTGAGRILVIDAREYINLYL